MARIPVEKKGGVPWWVWLLALFLLAGVIWWVAVAGDDEVEPVATEEVVPVVPAEPVPDPAAGGVITDVSTLLNADGLQQFVGREVQLSDMRVTSVVGDQTFWATPNNMPSERRFFVVLREQLTPGTPTEGRYDVTEGQIITINGSVHELVNTEASAWGLTEQEVQGLGNDAIYLAAQSLDITQRP